MVGERRQHARLVPSSPMFVSLDDSKRGLLLDVGQGGVAVASMATRNLDDVIALSFQLPEGRGQVQALAEVAWTRDSGHLTGARFLNLDDLSRQQLWDWLGAIVLTAPERIADDEATPTDAKQLNLIAEKEDSSPTTEDLSASPATEEVVNNPNEWPSETSSEGQAPIILESTDLESAEREVSEAQTTLSSSFQDAPIESASIETDSMESDAIEEAPGPDALHQDATFHVAPVEDAPIFVTRSSYARLEQAPQGTEHEEASQAASVWQPSIETGSEPPQVLTELGLSGGPAKGRHTIELILAVVLLSWALVYLGYQMGSTRVGRQTAGDAGSVANSENAAKQPAGEAAPGGFVPSVQASPAVKRESPSALTLGDSGVVLQVGAMKLEDNADGLAQELQKKNLPAFVFRHGQDALYRVAVGPFSDEDATAKVKAKLEKQGLKPIVRRWLPE
jgi:cell division septation protein DedD